MAKARKASVTQSKIGMIVYGEQYTGKSTIASQFAYFKRPDGKPFRVLYLDPESGSIDDYLEDMENNGVDLGNIYIVYTQSLGEVEQYISKVKNNEDIYVLNDDGEETDEVLLDADGEPFRADAVVVDGATILNLTTKNGLVEFSKKRNKVKANAQNLTGDEKVVKIEGAFLELKDYNTINFKGQNFILDLMSCGVHYLVTARETDEKQSIQLPDGTTTSVVTGRKQPDGFKGMQYNAKTVCRMFRDEDGQVCMHVEKDRSKVHKENEIVVDPSLLDWEAVVNKSAGKKEFVIKNDLVKAVQVEQDIYKKEILGDSDVTVSTERAKETTAPTKDVTVMQTDIEKLLKSLNPRQKTDVKEALTKAGISLKIKTITNIADLEKIKEIVSKVMA